MTAEPVAASTAQRCGEPASPALRAVLRAADREYGAKQRLLAFLPEALIFLVLLPALLSRSGGWLDHRLGLPSLRRPPFSGLLGGVMVVTGWLYAMWSIAVQFVHGRGTPVPAMATQELVAAGPYAHTRNPMALGTILMYAGVAVVRGSLGALMLVAAGAVALLTYIRRFEEREMVLRFGQSYIDYRARTPFLIPRPPRS